MHNINVKPEFCQKWLNPSSTSLMYVTFETQRNKKSKLIKNMFQICDAVYILHFMKTNSYQQSAGCHWSDQHFHLQYQNSLKAVNCMLLALFNIVHNINVKPEFSQKWLNPFTPSTSLIWILKLREIKKSIDWSKNMFQTCDAVYVLNFMKTNSYQQSAGCHWSDQHFHFHYQNSLKAVNYM